MQGKWVGAVAACLTLAAWAGAAGADPPPLTLWACQIGSSADDRPRGIAVDGGGNSRIAGWTYGDLAAPSEGYNDGFVAYFDSAGTVQWMRQIGTASNDHATAIAVDGSGNSHVSGGTYGDLGGPNQGQSDALAIKYDNGGTAQWTSQIGTVGFDSGSGIAVDGGGNGYLTGNTMLDLGGPNWGAQDAFVAKYNSGGTVQWTSQIGSTQDDYSSCIAVDGGGSSYITGGTYGDLGGPNQGATDGFAAKFDSDGAVQWVRQMGTSGADIATAIAADGSGNSYVAGHTGGDLGGPSQGGHDAFIVKYDSGGTLQWASQIGTAGTDQALGIALDGSGNIYITGPTYGDLGGPNQLSADVFVAMCDSGGTVRWIRQIGTASDDHTTGIALDGSGNIYVTGYTEGDLAGPNQGDRDAFVVAIGTTPASGGDANVDGCVDGLDYVIWSNSYDTLTGGKAWGHGDSNGDGYVDGLDYIAWSNNYLVGCPVLVPEPAALALLGLGALALLRRRSAQVIRPRREG